MSNNGLGSDFLSDNGPSKNVPSHIVALDFGGTKLASGLVDRMGNIIDQTVTLREGRSPKKVAAWAANELEEQLERTGLTIANLAGIGSTVPGYVNREKRVLDYAPAHGWRDVPFAQMLQDAIGLPATIENDVNACAVAEQRFGCATNGDDFLWITVSTGIGSALVLRGELFEGQGAAGEIGHFMIDENGPVCGCGHRGCLEALAGGLALGRLAQEKNLDVSKAKDLFELSANGSTVAAAVISKAMTDIARAVAFSTNLLDIPLVVFGGAIGLALDLDRLRACIAERILLPPERAPRIEKTALGYNAALLGAAALGFHRMEIDH